MSDPDPPLSHAQLIAGMNARRQPMQQALDYALRAARDSPCQKSKRGACVFNPFTGQVIQPAYNSRPDNQCDRLCQPLRVGLDRQIVFNETPTRCAVMCVHAEQRALRIAEAYAVRSEYVADGDLMFSLHEAELVHVKVDGQTGELVASGPPGCMWCAKEIAEARILGVWLYEAKFQNRAEHQGMHPPITKEQVTRPEWHYYPTKTFYDLTLQENGFT